MLGRPITDSMCEDIKCQAVDMLWASKENVTYNK